MSRGGMLLTSRNNTERGLRAIHLSSLQDLITLRKAFAWGIAITRGEGNQVPPNLSKARSAVL